MFRCELTKIFNQTDRKKTKAEKALAAEKKKENTNKAMDIIAKLKQNGFNGNVGAESSSVDNCSFDSTTSKSIDAAYLDENSDGVAMRIQSVNSIRFLLFVIQIQSVITISAT